MCLLVLPRPLLLRLVLRLPLISTDHMSDTRIALHNSSMRQNCCATRPCLKLICTSIKHPSVASYYQLARSLIYFLRIFLSAVLTSWNLKLNPCAYTHTHTHTHTHTPISDMHTLLLHSCLSTHIHKQHIRTASAHALHLYGLLIKHIRCCPTAQRLQSCALHVPVSWQAAHTVPPAPL